MYRIPAMALAVGLFAATPALGERLQVSWAGLTLELTPRHLEVVEVTKSSPAADAGLTPGTSIWFLGGQAVDGAFNFAALKRELEVPPGDVVEFRPGSAPVSGDGSKEPKKLMRRPGKLPRLEREFDWDRPLTWEQQWAMNEKKRSRYNDFEYKKADHQLSRPPPDRFVTARLAQPTAVVYPKPLATEPDTIRAGDMEKDVLSAPVRLEGGCSDDKVTEVTVTSTLGKERKKLNLTTSLGSFGRQFAGELTVPLWKMSASKTVCAEGHVHSLPFSVSVKCSDGPGVSGELSVAFEVRCDGDVDAVAGLFSKRHPTVQPDEVQAGAPATVEACVLVRSLGPAIIKATPVLLDEKGAVTTRFATVPVLPPGEADEVKAKVSLPAGAAGTVRVAFEAEQLDGAKVLSQPAAVYVTK
jgi:hypothetical protein